MARRRIAAREEESTSARVFSNASPADAVLDCDVLIAVLYFSWRDIFTTLTNQCRVKLHVCAEVSAEYEKFALGARHKQMVVGPKAHRVELASVGVLVLEDAQLDFDTAINLGDITQLLAKRLGTEGRNLGECATFATALLFKRVCIYKDGAVEKFRNKRLSLLTEMRKTIRLDPKQWVELEAWLKDDQLISHMSDAIILLCEVGALSHEKLREVERDMGSVGETFPHELKKYLRYNSPQGRRRQFRRLSAFWRLRVQELVNGKWVHPGGAAIE